MYESNYYYQPNQVARPPQQNQTVNNNIVWVQGLAGAKAYPVAPGAAVWMMDSEDKRFYLKSADGSGLPNPLRIFAYQEVVEQPETAANFDQFITREEFEKRIAALMGGKKDE